VTGKDLAQACRDWYHPALAVPLWILCEIAIVACDLAEVLGAAIGLQLLFGLPLFWGVLITALDVLLLLSLSRLGMRRLELIIVTLVGTIGACFGIEMALARPEVVEILRHVLPRDAAGVPSLFGRTADGGASVLGLHGESLFIAMGILGATVMPHNLYLHSGLVQTRAVEQSVEGKRQACRFNLVDSVVALNAALFVNAAILILSAAVFHGSGYQDVASLEDAHQLLTPLLGTSLASTVFALALLCSGQSSTITGTLAGQIVMEGFLRIRIRPWLRRLVSRGLAIVPAALTILWRGERAVDDLLLLSQVVLSLQLSFAVIPLITFTSDRSKMGPFANPRWVVALAVSVAVIIVGLNGKLVVEQVREWFAAAGPGAPWLWVTLVPVLVAVGALLAYVVGAPLLARAWPALMPTGVPTAPATAGSRAPRRGRAAPAAVAPVTAYRRIAVALELGSADAAVLEYLRHASFAPGAELVLVHVTESAASRYLGPETSDVESRADEAALAAIAGEFRARGLDVSVHLGHGDAAKEIVRLAVELEPDLLVTGGHGHGALADLFFGSTVAAVRHRVRCPVLSVPSGEKLRRGR
jgi:manganese transport protein